MAGPTEEDDELGPPIAPLAGLDQEPSEAFMGRVRGSIRRRQLAGEAAELSWTGMGAVLLEYLELVFGALRTREGDREGEDGRDPEEPR
ncbi:MAG: hypothetical protein IPG45_03745 [Deltaproteobacteria bacterium]|jgi:hypothetical protein|nr:hypothetical protein [Deltaproteobacteria bacterium]